ncbi:PAS domain S-box protein [Geojedonia litorea]|uniref:histidine kinase n=1 Tax=Geojedonia litorea TaxID=1268269 RepID=A0ABV9N8D6_9FLAO
MDLFYSNILMLLFQCTTIAILILVLFRLRFIFGTGLLWITLGVFQFLQVFMSGALIIEVAPEITISSGSMVLFTGSLFAIILVYICDGIIEAKNLIYAILGANLVLTFLLLLCWLSFGGVGSNNVYNLPSHFYIQNIGFLLYGTLVLVVDFFILIFIFEFISKYINSIYFRVLLTMTIVLCLDAILFTLGFFAGDHNFQTILISGIVFKTLSVIVYSSLFTMYLTYIEPNFKKGNDSGLSILKIFKSLTYLKRYEDVVVELQSERDHTFKLEHTINNISDGFVSLDTNWCYTYANEKTGEITGKKPGSLIGKHIWTEFPDTVNLPFYKAYHEAVETQQNITIQDFYEPTQRWVEHKLYPSPEGLAVYFSDITELKNAQDNVSKAKEFSEALIASLRSGLVVMNIDGEIIDANPSFCKITKFTKEELLGRKAPFPFWPPESYEAIQECLKKTLQGEVGNFEFLFLRKDGERFPAALATSSIRDSRGNLTAFFVTIDDITDRKKAEEQLILSENLFRRLTSNAPVAIFQIDKKGACNYVNEEWVKYAGRSFNEAMGFGWANAIHSEDRERVLQEWEESMRTGENFNSEFRFQHTNNQITWLSAKAVGLHDSKNNLYGYIGMALDITERKNAEKLLIESKEYLDNIINNIGDPVFVKDDKSRFLIANNAFYKLFNRTKEEIIGNRFADDVPKEKREHYLKVDRKVISKGIEYVNEDSMINAKGEVQFISSKKTRFIDENGHKFLIGVIRDITDLKKVEIELEKHQKNLEELIEIRTFELEEEKKKAQSADVMKSAFLATMSHELRTPMNSIIGFTGILLKEFAGPLNEEQKKQLTMVKNSGQHLLNLINDILDISKIEAGKLKVSKHTFNYILTLESTIAFILPQAHKKGLQISTECSETKIIVNSDERRVEQVLLNLISNAIKFSDQGSIKVNVKVEDKFILTQVIDQGIGISQEEQAKLFLPFIQLNHGLARRHEGTGLGLSICKNIIEKLGGTIEVKSKKGIGSNFTFKLPI